MVDEFKPVKKMSPVAKYSLVAGAILTTLLLFGWFFDRDLLPPSKADVTEAHNKIEQRQDDQDRKREENEKASKIRDLRAEWRYKSDQIIFHTKEKNDAMVSELKKRLREIEMDIAALEKAT